MSYPNMSYCMNSNTLLALQQILNCMNDEGADQFFKDLSSEERRAFQELVYACGEFVEQSQDIDM